VSVWNVHLLGGGLAGMGLEALVAGCHNGGLVWLLYMRCCALRALYKDLYQISPSSVKK